MQRELSGGDLHSMDPATEQDPRMPRQQAPTEKVGSARRAKRAEGGFKHRCFFPWFERLSLEQGQKTELFV